MFGVHLVCYLGIQGMVNAVGHLYGRKPHPEAAGYDLAWLAIPLLGHGYHNSHHAHPAAARTGALDPIWPILRVVGCARPGRARRSPDRGLPARALLRGDGPARLLAASDLVAVSRVDAANCNQNGAELVADRPVGADQHAGARRRRRHQLQPAGGAVVREQPLAAAEHDGLDHEAVLVDQVVAHQLCGQ